MKVWLDDVRDPRLASSHLSSQDLPEEYVESWKAPDVIWVKDAIGCVHLLETGKVTQISLDHDLGYQGGCGADVANWIEQAAAEGRIPRLKWTVHSANPVGARSMRVAMRNAERFWRAKKPLQFPSKKEAVAEANLRTRTTEQQHYAMRVDGNWMVQNLVTKGYV